AGRLALVTGFIIVVGGLGTWLISPSHEGPHHIAVDTIGCSGVVFGYATYLLTRGIFNRSLLEVMVGLLVGVVWGSVLISSLVPHTGISWQAHACGAVAGVIVAWRLSEHDRRSGRGGRLAGSPAASSAAPPSPSR
ncbi:MAG TPA: rhomboid family intramembrane serine protease, partial [Solirubrobacteraceae bacterium]|nr:rhomboid family intramembrane serine protease [Solirubrobacteraceae bacterium]